MLKKLTLLCVTAVVVFMIGFTIAPKNVDAHDIGYRWWNSNTKHMNINTSWGWAAADTAGAFNATDLTSVASTTGGDGTIYYQNLDLGAGGPVGRTIAYNTLNQACASISTGVVNTNCNKTDRKAKIAYVYFNEATYKNFINTHTRFLFRHETGHALGLNHVECSTPSVMFDGSCPIGANALSVHDTNDINGWY